MDRQESGEVVLRFCVVEHDVRSPAVRGALRANVVVLPPPVIEVVMSIYGMNPRWKGSVKAVQFAQTQFHLSLVGLCSRTLVFIFIFPHVPAGVRTRSDLRLRHT